MTDAPKADPIEFIRRGSGDAKTELIACGTCGHVYSPRIYAGSYERALEATRRAAVECVMCRQETMSPEKDMAEREAQRLKRISAATVVTDLDYCFSDRGDASYNSPADAADAGETGVFGATFRPFRIDLENLLENVVENHHDEASTEDLDGIDALADAVEEFNKLQKMGSYDMDEKHWQKVPQHQTFAMIKPDATARGVEGDMMDDMRAAGFRIVDQKRRALERSEAEWLYQEHRSKDHFNDLVDYTISGEVVLLLIEGDQDDVATAFRQLMGPTDRTKAEPHTLRAKYAVGYRENSIHGSDSPAAAINEIIRFMH